VSAAAPERGRPFSLGGGRRLGTVLAILAFLGLAGFAFGAILGTDLDVEPYTGEGGPQPPAVRPQPAPGGDDEGSGVVRFGPDAVGAIVVPDGWTVVEQTDELVTVQTDGIRFTARIDEGEPTVPATQVLTEAQETVLSSAVAAHVRTSDAQVLQPFGALVTRSAVGYTAVRTDLQGLSWVSGNLFAFVRLDGMAMTIRVEVVPASDWDDRIQGWFALYSSVVANFAEAPLPA
jgi:hypothetical protein